MDEDLKPYICISERCAEQLVAFATFHAWHDHMRTEHGPVWHQIVQPTEAWFCPVCSDKPHTAFRDSQALYTHMDDAHQFSGPQLEAIVQLSRAQVRRRPDVCPLCCFQVENSLEATTRSMSSGKQKEQLVVTQGLPQRPRKADETARRALPPREQAHAGDPQTKSDGDAGERHTTPAPAELMARHVAGHLQGLMFITIRLMSQRESNNEISSTGSPTTTIGDDLMDRRSSRQWLPSGEGSEIAGISDSGSIGGQGKETRDQSNQVPSLEYNADWTGIISW
jgi:hypothetical protein